MAVTQHGDQHSLKTSRIFHQSPHWLRNFEVYFFWTRVIILSRSRPTHSLVFTSGELTSVSWKIHIVPPWYFFFLASLSLPCCILKKTHIKKLCVLCKAKKKGTGSTYCGGRSSPGFHPLPRQILSSRRSPRFYSTAFWDLWSSQEESRRCRRLQVWREVSWFLPWPSPPLSTIPGNCFVSFFSSAGAPLWPPTSH